jgi:hypothetical protein
MDNKIEISIFEFQNFNFRNQTEIVDVVVLSSSEYDEFSPSTTNWRWLCDRITFADAVGCPLNITTCMGGDGEKWVMRIDPDRINSYGLDFIKGLQTRLNRRRLRNRGEFDLDAIENTKDKYAQHLWDVLYDEHVRHQTLCLVFGFDFYTRIHIRLEKLDYHEIMYFANSLDDLHPLKHHCRQLINFLISKWEQEYYK